MWVLERPIPVDVEELRVRRHEKETVSIAVSTNTGVMPGMLSTRPEPLAPAFAGLPRQPYLVSHLHRICRHIHHTTTPLYYVYLVIYIYIHTFFVLFI